MQIHTEGKTGVDALAGPCNRSDVTLRRFATRVWATRLVSREWATSADDILWRRSKPGLVLTAAEASALDIYLGSTRKASAGDNVAVAE